MLGQIEWWIQNGPIIKNGVLLLTSLIFENFVSVEGALINSWSDAPTIQMPMFVLFVSAEVLFDGAFSLWVCEYSWLLLLIEDYWCIKRNHLDHFLTKSCSLSNK